MLAANRDAALLRDADGQSERDSSATSAPADFSTTSKPGIAARRHRRYAGSAMKPLPFRGGWFVYLGYEMAAEIEPRLQLPRADAPYSAFALRVEQLRRPRSRHAAAFSRSRKTAMPTRMRGSSRDLEQADAATAAAIDARPPALAALDEEPPELFLARVRAAQEYIAAGDIYQANLSRPWHLTLRDRRDADARLQRAAPREPGAICGLRAVARHDRSSRRRPSGCCASRAARFRRDPSPARARARDRPSRTGAIPPSSWRIPRNAPNTSC